ncbi:MAG: DUF4910 domain-containing protein [Promethearchaeota archaeon]
MKINQLVEILTNDISSQSVMNMVSRISQYHRIQGSSGYFEAAKYIQSVLNKNGLETRLYEFPANGSWEHWGWIAPISWNITSGECWITKPVKKRLCNYQNVPMSVITHSNPCDFEASLVDAGKGDQVGDYEKAKDKIALITGSPRKIFHLAAEHGVKGLILHPNEERAANLMLNTVQYDGFWPIAENLSKVTSGFSISNKQALELKKYLEVNEEVLVRFKINAGFSINNGKLHVLEAIIKGSKKPLEEIILISHLCHPSAGANDNASGSASLAELILSLNRMIIKGELPQPEKTLKFLWVPEFSGTIPWLKLYDDQRNQRKIISVFNLDMVGESPRKIGTPLTINCPSCATPSYLKALLNNAAKCTSEKMTVSYEDGRIFRLNYRLNPFAGGSDHLIFNDRHFSIPSVMLGHEDPFHHSSADSIDKVDPYECKSAAIIAGSAAFSLSVIDNQFLKELAYFVFLEGVEDMLRHELYLDQGGLPKSQQGKQRILLEKSIIERMESILELNPEAEIQENITYFLQTIKNHFSRMAKELKIDSEEVTEEKLTKMKIKRNYLGPISYKQLDRTDRSKEEKKAFESLTKEYWGGIVLELLNLADGILTIEEIFLLLNIYYPNVEFNDVLSIVKLFQKEKILIKV